MAAILLTAYGAEKGIEAHKVWMRPAAQGENEAVYLMIHNHASQADELISVSSDAAQAVELDRAYRRRCDRDEEAELRARGSICLKLNLPGQLSCHADWAQPRPLQCGRSNRDHTAISENQSDLPIRVPVQNILLPEHEGH